MKLLNTFANVTWEARKVSERNPDLHVSTGEVIESLYNASNGDAISTLTDWQAWFIEENENGADTEIEDVFDLITELENVDVIQREVSDNTFNYNGMLDGALDFRLLYFEEKVIALVKIHLGGDVRGNYTDFFALEFDADYDFYEALDVSKSVTVEGFHCYVTALQEGISCADEDNEFTVYAYDMEELKVALTAEVEQ